MSNRTQYHMSKKRAQPTVSQLQFPVFQPSGSDLASLARVCTCCRGRVGLLEEEGECGWPSIGTRARLE